MYGMQDSTARDEELAWRLANQDWTRDAALQRQLSKEEQQLEQRRKNQEAADEAFARQLQRQMTAQGQQKRPQQHQQHQQHQQQQQQQYQQYQQYQQ